MKKTLHLLGCVLLSLLLTNCANFQSINGIFSGAKQNPPPRKHLSTHQNSASDDNTELFASDFNTENLNKNTSGSSGNLWAEIAKNEKLSNEESRPEVQAQIRWFMTHQGYLQRTTDRARPYLYIVYQEVKNRDLPSELILLPINESAYYPFSYSNRGASGIWQLMPGAASDYGLKRNFWYDGRRDIFDSTNAALDYLTYLAHYFNGDWLLAIAAYNTGEGNVEHAIERNARAGLPTDFWSLRLSEQTRAYVPKLLALAAIVSDPNRYGITLPPVDNKPVIQEVRVDQQLRLSDAAKLAGISLGQLKTLNPGLSHTTTEPHDSKLFLPIDSIQNFKTNLSSFSASPIPTRSLGSGRYRVQRGDTLQSIADHFGITVDELKHANNWFGRHVPTGKILNIPSSPENYQPNTEINLDHTSLTLTHHTHTVTTIHHQAKTKTSTHTKPQHVLKHKVLKGETLSSIAAHYHVSVAQLQKLNPGSARLHPGQVLTIQMTGR